MCGKSSNTYINAEQIEYAKQTDANKYMQNFTFFKISRTHAWKMTPFLDFANSRIQLWYLDKCFPQKNWTHLFLLCWICGYQHTNHQRMSSLEITARQMFGGQQKFVYIR